MYKIDRRGEGGPGGGSKNGSLGNYPIEILQLNPKYVLNRGGGAYII